MIDFFVDLWYSLNPQSVVVSGILGLVVVLVFEFLKGKKMAYKVGDYVKVVSMDFSKSEISQGDIPDKALGKTGKVEYVYEDGDIRVIFKDKELIRDILHRKVGWAFPLENVEPSTEAEYNSEAKVEEPKPSPTSAIHEYKKGDAIKVKGLSLLGLGTTLQREFGTTNTSGMEIIVECDEGLTVGAKINGKSNSGGVCGLFWISKEDIELAQTKTEKTKGNEPMKNEWILFSSEIPSRRDIEVSTDGKSWRVKEEVVLVATKPEPKTETKNEEKGSEPMKTETPKTAKIKLNWRPITNTEDLEDGEVYYVRTNNDCMECAVYNEGCYDNPSECFELTNDNGDKVDCDPVAFYIHWEEFDNLIEFPSESEIEKVLEEEENESEVKDEVEALLEVIADADVEKQAKLVALLKKKIPGLA